MAAITANDDMEPAVASGGEQKPPPKNFAWHPIHGYQGLVLHTISPRLADLIFPIIASDVGEVLFSAILVFSCFFSMTPYFFRSCPDSWTHISYLAYIPALQRLMLIDLRLARLQLREFESAFLLANWIVGFWAHFYIYDLLVFHVNMWVAGFNTFILDAVRCPAHASIQTSGAYVVLSIFWGIVNNEGWARHLDKDATFPGTNISAGPVLAGRLATFAVYFGKYTFWLVMDPTSYIVLKKPVINTGSSGDRSSTKVRPSLEEKGTVMVKPKVKPPPKEMMDEEGEEDNSPRPDGDDEEEDDTREEPLATLTNSPASTGSSTTIKKKDADSADASPQPSSSSGGGGGGKTTSFVTTNPIIIATTTHSSPSRVGPVTRGSHSLQTTRNDDNTAPNSQDHGGGDGGLVLHLLLRPERAAVVHRLLVSETSTYLCNGCLFAGAAFFGIPSLSQQIPAYLLHGAALLHIPAARCALLIDRRVFRRVNRYFETAFLTFNWLLLLYCALRTHLFTRTEAAVSSFHMIVTGGTVIILDSVQLKPSAKLPIPAVYSVCVLAWALFNVWHLHVYMDYHAKMEVLGFPILVVSFLVARLANLGPYFLKNWYGLWVRPEVYVVISDKLSRNDTSHLLVSTLRDMDGVTGGRTTTRSFFQIGQQYRIGRGSVSLTG